MLINEPWSWLYAVCFLDLLGASMIMPVFSTHLRSLGVSHTSVGLLSSLYGVTQLISGPIIGSWSDINGRRSVLCLSMVICAAAYCLMGIVSSFYLFVVIRCILGSFKHPQTLCRAYSADIVPAEKQTSVLGLMNAFTSLSFMIGPTVAGHVMEIENGFQYLSVSVALIFLLNALVVFIFAKNRHTSVKNKTNNNNNLAEQITEVFKELYNIEWSHFWALFSIKFLFALSSILFFQNMGLYLIEIFGITPRYMGYTISFYGFVSMLCNLGTGRVEFLRFLPNRHLEMLTILFFVMTVAFFLLYTINIYVFFIIGLIPLAASQAISRSLLTEVLLEQSDDSHRGSVVGASSSIAAIARIITPFLFGVISTWGGVSDSLLASSFVAAIACILTLVYSYQIKKSSLKAKKE